MQNETEKYQTLQHQLAVLEAENNAFRENEKIFKALVETAVGYIGQDFFNSIVIRLAEWLKVDCVVIGIVNERLWVDARPMYLDGQLSYDYSYELKHTPCDVTTKKGFSYFEQNIQQLFPEDKDLIGFKAESYVGTALRNENGDTIGILCAFSRKKLQLPPQAEDILKIIAARISAEIERIKDHDILETSEAKLREANAAKDKFFSIIAHDLKSPFNTLMGFSELLEKNVQHKNLDKMEETTRLIKQTLNQTLVLLDNLLEWSQAQTGRLKYSPELFNLAKLINENIVLMQPVANRKNIRLSVSVASQLQITADKNMISTVIRNLLSNAIKYTNSDGLVVVSATQNIQETKISISDNGVGIKPEHMNNLFRIDSGISTLGTADEKGTGLGLALCREFIEKHHGKLWVESEWGRGSTFCVSLPNY